MSTSLGRGSHAAPGRAVAVSAYDRYLGRWSRLSVPDLLAAAKIVQGCRVLDVATGTGEAALMAIRIVGNTGFVVGADISLEMVRSARVRLNEALYWPVNADGQALPFKDAAFDAAVCQLGLQFFPNPAAGLKEFPACRPIRRDGSGLRQRHIRPFNNATCSRCHGRSPIQRCWEDCSATQASRTSVSNGSGVRAPSIASMTTWHRSKKGLGKSRRLTVRSTN
jgi:SAM-dependent methyltransferase